MNIPARHSIAYPEQLERPVLGFEGLRLRLQKSRDVDFSSVRRSLLQFKIGWCQNNANKSQV